MRGTPANLPGSRGKRLLEKLRSREFWRSRAGRVLLAAVLLVVLGGGGAFLYYYVHFSHLIDQRLSGQIFQNTSRIYSAPATIFTGESLKPGELATHLLRAGYTTAEMQGAAGRYWASGSSVEIHPSADSFFQGGNALRVDFSAGSISRITGLQDGRALDSAEIEPVLLTNLFDSSREKRRVMRFEDLPKIMVDAVLSAEDKRFFEHGGLDYIRVFGAAWADLRGSAIKQGASTLDMQVARSFFFTTKREWRRKIAETMVAFELEHRFTKQQIFELYANEVYLGNRGSFAIRGFGEASQAYFGKDLRELTLGEAAFLAGIIRQPNRYSLAERHPERVAEPRDRVLAQMVENGYITPEQAAAAKKMPLHFVNQTDTGAAPYFVDMVRDHLLENISESDLETQSYRVYTTLDPDLQRAASEALAAGMLDVDAKLQRRYDSWRKKGEPSPRVQGAVVALDPKSGRILALVGGRNYGESQLNHVLAMRQPGSSFKPFVYAAAFESAVDGAQPLVTPDTTVVDEPTTFEFDGKEYDPGNYNAEYLGTVTLRDALAHSLNVATVKVAEMVGYRRVVDVVRQMGLDTRILATPALALGAYEMTPLDVSAGYTIFANGGTRAAPYFVERVVNTQGLTVEENSPRTRAALDPRVSYLVTNLMQDVLNRGTGSVVRRLGFTAPAAGKTGTSRDGWFAGFTSNLLCVVWVGFDDNRDLGLAGAASAGPIWTEFMKRAIALPHYRDVRDFAMPPGVVAATIDPASGELATPQCPATENDVFVAGTEPRVYCHLHGGENYVPPPPSTSAANSDEPPGSLDAAGAPGAPKKKKSLFKKIFGIFGNSKSPSDSQPKPNPNP